MESHLVDIICTSELFLQHDSERSKSNHSDVSRSGISTTFPINKSFSFRLGMVKSWPKRIYHLWSPQLVSVTFIRPMTELRTKDPPFFAGIVCGTVCPKAKTGCSTHWKYLDGQTCWLLITNHVWCLTMSDPNKYQPMDIPGYVYKASYTIAPGDHPNSTPRVFFSGTPEGFLEECT